MFKKFCGINCSLLQRFNHDQSGATTIEYGFIVGIISIVVLITLTAIGETMRDDIFGTIASVLQSNTPSE